MKSVLIITAIVISFFSNAQNVGIGTSTPDVNAKLDITATDKGVLIPRMDSVHRKAIPNTVGLLVYDSTTKSFWYNNGNAWQNMAIAVSAWSLTGNAGTDPSVNFVGTTDDKPLVFKIGNQPAGGIRGTTVSLGLDAFSSNANTPALTAIGYGALHHNITNGATGIGGYANTAVGSATLYNNTTGLNNTAIGESTLNLNTTGQGNTAVGSTAMLHNITGINNSAYGGGALYINETGNYNTAIGASALASSLSKEFNTAVGAFAAANSNTAGNTAIGYKTLNNNFLGANNTAIGYNADLSVNNVKIENATAIGANAKVDASNKIRLGDANVTIVESNGVFNTVSDGRFKYNIQENVKGLAFILKLRPVTYQFDTKKQEAFTKGSLSTEELNSQAIPAAFNETNDIKRTGFIAQEVAAAAEKTGYDFDGVKIPASDKQYYSLSYASFVVPLVKAMQEQQQTINELKKQNDMLLKRLEALEKK